MNMNRDSVIFRLLLLTLTALVLAACGGDNPAANRSRANEEVGVLGTALAEAVTNSYQASTGRIEPEKALRSIADVRESAERLGEVATVVDARAQSLVQELLVLTERALVFISQREFEQAEQLRLEEYMTIAAQLAELPLDATTETPQVPSSEPSRIVLFSLIGLACVGVPMAFILSRRSAARGGQPRGAGQPEATPSSTFSPSRPPPSQFDQTWSEIPSMFASGQTGEAPISEETQADRSQTARIIEVDLRALLDSVIIQMKQQGWGVTLVSPSVEIAVDPVKFRQAMLTALRNALLGGAKQCGILVEILDQGVLLTIGRDVPPEKSDAEEFSKRFVSQVAASFGLDELEWALVHDEELTLTTVALDSRVLGRSLSGPVA
jgi:hypothetical protein